MAVLAATLEHDGKHYAAEMCLITRTQLYREDHGMFTGQLHVDFAGGSSTALGGFALDDCPPKDAPNPRRRPGTAEGLDWVIRTIEVVCGYYGGWEDIKGKRCLALFDSEVGRYSRCGANCKGIASVDGDRVLIFDDIWKKETADATSS